MVKKPFFVKKAYAKRLTNDREKGRIIGVKTSSVAFEFAESLPLAVR